MSRWFRHYAGMMRDEKLVRVALRAKQPIERVVWVWGAILESAAEINDGGRYEVDFAEMSYFLRAPEEDIAAIADALRGLGRISEGAVAKWGDRQFQSDQSAERQKRYRDRQKKSSEGEEIDIDGEVTSPSRHGDAPETETETETEKKVSSRKARLTDEEFEKFKKAYPRRKGSNPWQPARKKLDTLIANGATTLDEVVLALQRCVGYDPDKRDTEYIPQAVKWLNDQRWRDVPAAPTLPVPINPGEREVEFFKRVGRWNAAYGPEPGQIGCRVPTEILAKFGYTEAA